jgi:SAM-dependent methyltransferase
VAKLRRSLTSALVGLGRIFERLAEASFHAAAGTLRSKELEAAIARFWAGFGSSATHIAGGLMTWEREFYLRFLKPDARILIVGSGTGRDLIALVRLGFRADGIELAEEATTCAADLHGSYDAIVFSWFCYGYIPEASRRIRILRRLAEHLAADGHILISYNSRDRSPSPLATSAAQLAARLSGSDWRPAPGDAVFFARDSAALQYEHRFEPGELEAEARAAGLVVVFDAHVPEGTAALAPETAGRWR